MKKIVFNLLLALALSISFPAAILAQEETTEKVSPTEQMEAQAPSDSVLIQKVEEKSLLDEVKPNKETKSSALEPEFD